MSNHLPTEERIALTDDQWERMTEPFMDGSPFNNSRVEDGVGIVDFFLDRFLRGAKRMPGQRQRRSLEEALHKHDILQAVTVTADTDPPMGLRFFNVHIPVDEHLEERLAIASTAVTDWRQEHNYYRW